MRATILAATVLSIVLAACGQPSTSESASALDWTAGDYPPEIERQSYLNIDGVDGQQGLSRQYKVHVPPGYDPAVPAPLLFCLHGLVQDPVMFCVKSTRLVEKSDAEGFILVMPFGYQRSWNGGTCCGTAARMELDDVTLIRAIFAEVSHHLNVDRRRIYATGLSTGGFLSYRLACEAADLFAAVAPAAGAIGTEAIARGSSDLADCDPAMPISVFDTHGTADPLVPFSVQQPSIELIAEKNGCTLQTEPAAQPLSGGDTVCVSYRGCPAGVTVTRCSVEKKVGIAGSGVRAAAPAAVWPELSVRSSLAATATRWSTPTLHGTSSPMRHAERSTLPQNSEAVRAFIL